MQGRSDKLSLIAGIFVTCVMVFLLAGSSQVIGINAEKEYPENELPVVGSVENLHKLLQDSQSKIIYMNSNARLGGMDMAKEAMPAAENQASKDELAADYSATNTQVQGVDEADLVKTDGEYIYKVNADRVLIIKAYPVDNMQVINSLEFAKDFSPREIFVDKNNLVVIGTKHQAYYQTFTQEKKRVRPEIYPYYPQRPNTVAMVYNIKDKNNLEKIRDLELEGDYLSARKIDQTLYLISRRGIDFHILERETGVAPAYRDSIKGTEFQELSLNEVRYFPECITPDYLTVAALDLSKPGAGAQVESYLGGGENIYASPENLYIALSIFPNSVAPAQQERGLNDTEATKIYRFALEKGRFNYSGTGSVPGRILNQFSMDEHKDTFRIATTTGDMWSNENTSQNNLYILDAELKQIGKIEGIAPGEKIYSTRFMGDKAYMVTFRDVDPFFVLDLKDPKNPKILGKLKIPGYSDYLHPYDENHIIGFGKDTVATKGWNGEPQAYYQGMKIAIFDVSDVNNPIEMSKTVIGARGTDSELLRNHKALLFNKEKNLLAFPITVREINAQDQAENPEVMATRYGTFAFSGAYVYNIDLHNGLQLKAQITHLTPEDYTRAGDYWGDSSKNVQRIMYIGDTLYTISEGMLKANNINTMQELGSLKLEKVQ